MFRKKHPRQRLDELQALERRVSKKTEFFMSASHQLKSPVAIIQWCLQTIEEQGHIDPKTRELTSKALVQANAMSQLITDMLHVFKLQDRHGKARNFVPVDMNTLVDQVLGQYEVLAHNRGVRLVRGPQEHVPPVLAEEGYMRQAIINLVDNAIKYSPKGGAIEVELCLAKDGWVELSVCDHGIGMTEADQLHLFTEFYRSTEAREVSHEGTGLGLVIVRNIIDEFGGTVEVKSRVHRGSTFTIRLPGIKGT